MVMDPTPKERRHVWRCILLSEILIGDESDVWSDPIAWRALVTLRYCLSAIKQLIDFNCAVTAGNIEAVVMQTDDLDGVPYSLPEVAEYLHGDPEARTWWQSMFNDARFPHRCPFCSSAAYVGFNTVECRGRCRG